MNYKYLYIFIAFLFINACNPAKRIAKELQIDKSDIETILESAGSRSKYFEKKDNYRVLANKRSIGPKDVDTTLYSLLGNFAIEEIHGPFLERDSSIYYLKITAKSQKEYVSYTEAQIWQPFGISDDIFLSIMDSVTQVCFNKQLEIEKLLDEFESENIRKGIVFTVQNVDVDKLIPEGVALLRSASMLSMFLYKKEELPTTDVAIYFQKIEDIVAYDIFSYNYIRINKSKENDK